MARLRPRYTSGTLHGDGISLGRHQWLQAPFATVSPPPLAKSRRCVVALASDIEEVSELSPLRILVVEEMQ